MKATIKTWARQSVRKEYTKGLKTNTSRDNKTHTNMQNYSTFALYKQQTNGKDLFYAKMSGKGPATLFGGCEKKNAVVDKSADRNRGKAKRCRKRTRKKSFPHNSFDRVQ